MSQPDQWMLEKTAEVEDENAIVETEEPVLRPLPNVIAEAGNVVAGETGAEKNAADTGDAPQSVLCSSTFEYPGSPTALYHAVDMALSPLFRDLHSLQEPIHITTEGGSFKLEFLKTPSPVKSVKSFNSLKTPKRTSSAMPKLPQMSPVAFSAETFFDEVDLLPPVPAAEAVSGASFRTPSVPLSRRPQNPYANLSRPTNNPYRRKAVAPPEPPKAPKKPKAKRQQNIDIYMASKSPRSAERARYSEEDRIDALSEPWHEHSFPDSWM